MTPPIQPIQVRASGNSGNEAILLLRAMLGKQNEQNALLQSLVQRQNDTSRSNAAWKTANPALSKRCATSVKRANELMTELVEKLVTDMEELTEDEGWENNFAVFELIDKYGQKIQQFNVIIQTLSQLGTP